MIVTTSPCHLFYGKYLSDLWLVMSVQCLLSELMSEVTVNPAMLLLIYNFTVNTKFPVACSKICESMSGLHCCCGSYRSDEVMDMATETKCPCISWALCSVGGS